MQVLMFISVLLLLILCSLPSPNQQNREKELEVVGFVAHSVYVHMDMYYHSFDNSTYY